MKKFYNTPDVLIKDFEIKETISTSAVADGTIDDRDDDTVDMTGEV